MKNHIGKKVLITTQNWFTAPDGSDYKAVWGTLKAIHTSQDTLGFTPSRQNTNWYVEVGNMVIAGCQVFYLILSESEPNFDKADSYSIAPGQAAYTEYKRLSHIYKAID